ncbi:Tad domain-containing protein [Actinomadura fulvescens]|uniref:Putative Flp pilus-assembly TadG-like N-terminal domain-containing protein n=1 Tax=Actinomadura fulvescens TaxID=46160 RepID=A0ABN3QE98_9ACTN
MTDDRGTVSLYVVLFTPTVLLLAGLLVDGGLAIHARQRAADMAEQAARAGANQINEAKLRETGKPVIDPGRAEVAACALLSDYDDNITGRSCGATEEEVEVTVELTVNPQFLSIVPGFGAFTMSSTASAQPITGDEP